MWTSCSQGTSASVTDQTRKALKELGLQRQPHAGLLPGSKIGRLGGLATAGHPDQLAKMFRRKTRELLNEKDIQELIRKRVVAELTGLLGPDGRPTDVKITPVLMKIAGAQRPAGRADEGPRFSVPSIHVHLEKLTEQELDDFVTKGIRPASLQLPPSREED